MILVRSECERWLCCSRGEQRGGAGDVIWGEREMDWWEGDSDFHLHICTSHELRHVNTWDGGHMFSVTTECTCVICPLVSDVTHVTCDWLMTFHDSRPRPHITHLIPRNYHPHLLLRRNSRVFTLNARIDRNQPPWNSFENAATYSDTNVWGCSLGSLFWFDQESGRKSLIIPRVNPAMCLIDNFNLTMRYPPCNQTINYEVIEFWKSLILLMKCWENQEIISSQYDIIGLAYLKLTLLIILVNWRPCWTDPVPVIHLCLTCKQKHKDYEEICVL